jgi:hypothetical protein
LNSLKFLLLLAPLLLLASAQLQVSYLLLASLLFLIPPVAGVPGIGEFLAVTGHPALLLALVLALRFPFLLATLFCVHLCYCWPLYKGSVILLLVSLLLQALLILLISLRMAWCSSYCWHDGGIPTEYCHLTKRLLHCKIQP